MVVIYADESYRGGEDQQQRTFGILNGGQSGPSADISDCLLNIDRLSAYILDKDPSGDFHYENFIGREIITGKCVNSKGNRFAIIREGLTDLELETLAIELSKSQQEGA
jgi:hypothetical protein